MIEKFKLKKLVKLNTLNVFDQEIIITQAAER